ncbi:MAG: tRNA-dihydrouridine synthase, partial [Acidithiobacillales bacterium]
MRPPLVLESSGARPCVVSPPLVLAPMAGITDVTYRLLLRRIGGVGLVTMEFVSSEGLTRGNKRTERLLRFDPAERPLSVQ